MLTKARIVAATISDQTAMRRRLLITLGVEAATGTAGLAIAELIVPNAMVAPEKGGRIIPSGGWSSGADRRGDDRGDSRASAGRARDAECAADRLNAVAEAQEPLAVLLACAAASVVDD